MDAKIKACGKLQQVEEKHRDRVGQKLETMRQRHAHIETKLGQLADLKQHANSSTNSAPTFNSAALMNLTRVDQMLQKMLNHCQQEQAVLEAECAAVKHELEHRHARVQGLEKALERWKKKQSYEKARKEQRLLEEMINARLKRRAV
ncbi:flagellar export protein FliJ [Grimontia marina]|uniref:Flagellar FliJ protein n=1 Tax=Grimontia marina TaxID=646534 RepID=A0A128FHI0_9GAMM|nr:flagellar export protein FliJ [Grimontia marina]CZF86020.1 Flagellar FliJ protein [Grimontia marina]